MESKNVREWWWQVEGTCAEDVGKVPQHTHVRPTHYVATTTHVHMHTRTHTHNREREREEGRWRETYIESNHTAQAITKGMQ